MPLLGDERKGLTTGRMVRGCDLCFSGLKAVIFITGVCDESCFYCPIDMTRWGKRVIYVNEEKAHDVDAVIAEVQRQGARGASITGGDPLADLPLVLRVIRSLKDVMGERFHVHLYTPGRYATPEALMALWRAGLDEIRFHPVKREYFQAIRLAARLTGMSVGAEIPIAPGLEGWAMDVIRAVEEAGGSFVNMNELEFSDTNYNRLRMRALVPSGPRYPAAKGSLETALRVLRWASENSNVSVHFCPASYKAEFQVRNRFWMTGRRDRTWFEALTPEGLLVRGEVLRDGEVIAYFNPSSPPSQEEGLEYRVVASYPTRSREPRVCESTSEDPVEAVRDCMG
ncbi:MAG: radical SAM protein [Acidilobus sp.]